MKVKASSLIESLVAIVIITIVFSLSLAIFNQLIASNYLLQKANAQAEVAIWFRQMKLKSGIVQNQLIKVSGKNLTLEINIIPQNQFEKGIVVQITTKTHDGKIVDQQKKVIFPDEES